MMFRHTAPRGDGGTHHGFHLSENMRGALVVVIGAACMVGIAFGAMMMLTSPDGWVMKAANQALATAQQGTLASYDTADTR